MEAVDALFGSPEVKTITGEEGAAPVQKLEVEKPKLVAAKPAPAPAEEEEVVDEAPAVPKRGFGAKAAAPAAAPAPAPKPKAAPKVAPPTADIADDIAALIGGINADDA
jgi:hypothetical protein